MTANPTPSDPAVAPTDVKPGDVPPRGSAPSIKRLLGELRPYRRDLTIGLVCLVLSAPASLFHPLVWMYVVDHVIVRHELAYLIPALAMMFLVAGLGLGLNVIKDRLLARAGESFTQDLRNRAYRKLSHQSIAYLHRERTGDLTSRVISDIDAMQSSIIGGFTNLMEELVTFVAVLAAITWISWQIGLLVIVPLSLAYLIVRAYSARMKAVYRRGRELLGNVSAKLQDNLAGHLVIQAFSREAAEEKRFAAATQEYYDNSMKAVRLRTTIFPLVMMIGFSTNAIMLGVGAYLVYRGDFTLGGLVAMRAYWWQLNSPIRTLAQVNDLLQRALAASTRVYAVLDAPEEMADQPTATVLATADAPLVVDHVGFAYENGKTVLREINFTLQPGTRLALAGPSGGGKTTLLLMLMRFYDPTTGDIRCGDVSLRSVSKVAWRSHLALVSQETFLFHSTVKDNLLFGRPDATDEQIYEALDKANAKEFVEAMPQGLETIVGERGVKLSGGQRQRLGVARAFLANPRILLLDEPTSAVEPESESIIQASIEKLMVGRTVVLTSHRPSLLRRADRVLFIHQGRIAEDGTHADLMNRDGLYAQMYQGWERTEEGQDIGEFVASQRD